MSVAESVISELPLYVSKRRVVAYAIAGIFWVSALVTFAGEEISAEAYRNIQPLIQLTLDGCIIALGLWLLRSTADIILLATYCAISLVSTSWVNDGSLIQWLNGSRYYLPMLMLLPIFRYLFAERRSRELLRKASEKMMMAFLIIQVPCIVEQALRYGVGDHGGGSLGNNMSGVVSMMIYAFALYLMMHHWDSKRGYFSNLAAYPLPTLLLLPTFLNETKVSFVMLPMYLFFLLPAGRRYVAKVLTLVPLIVVASGVGFWIYTQSSGNTSEVFTRDAIEFYLTGNEASLVMIEALVDNDIDTEGEHIDDFARGLKFAALPLIIPSAPAGSTLGFGVGQFKGGSVLSKSRFALEYKWLLSGTQMMGMIWFLELGWLGVAWVAAFFAVAFRAFRKVEGRNIRLQFFLMLTLALIIVYNSTFLNTTFTIGFIYLIFMSSRDARPDSK